MFSSKNATGEAPIITNIMVRKKSNQQQQPLTQAINGSPVASRKFSGKSSTVGTRRFANGVGAAPAARSKSKSKTRSISNNRVTSRSKSKGKKVKAKKRPKTDQFLVDQHLISQVSNS